MKSHLAVGAWAWPPVGKEPEKPLAESALRIAPVWKEPPAARARGPRDQDKTRRRTWIWGTETRSEREPNGTCQRAGNITGSVDSTRRRALVRQVPLVEEPAESSAKKRQCDRRHRSKEQDDCASRTSATGGWPGVTRLRP